MEVVPHNLEAECEEEDGHIHNTPRKVQEGGEEEADHHSSDVEEVAAAGEDVKLDLDVKLVLQSC